MELKQKSWFQTDIYNVDIGVDKQLYPDIVKWKSKSDGVTLSNSGGWHSKTNMEERPEFKGIFDKVFSAVETVSNHIGVDLEKFELVSGGMWANVSGQYASNRVHNHPGCIWSFVYYVQTHKNCGDLIFLDPRIQAHIMYMPLKRQYERDIRYTPIEGRLIIFPSWLQHEVKINQSKHKRVSVSGNFYYKVR